MPEKCRSCGAEIVWRRTQSNANMPIDAQPDPDGNILLDPDGIHCRVLKQDELFASTDQLHRSHFATCKQAAKWRKK